MGLLKIQVEGKTASTCFQPFWTSNLYPMQQRPRKVTSNLPGQIEHTSPCFLLSGVFYYRSQGMSRTLQCQLSAFLHQHENSISHPNSICLAYSTPGTFRSRKMPNRKQLHDAGKCLNYSEKLYRWIRLDFGCGFLTILAGEGSKKSIEGLLELLEELWSGACGCTMGKVENCDSIALVILTTIKVGIHLWSHTFFDAIFC